MYIDSVFLNRVVKETLEFYQKSKPEKEFTPYNFGELVYTIAHNAKVNVVPGSRDNCADVCREKVDKEGKYYANHVYNPIFYEGTKTYIYEVYEQLGRIPENIFMVF